jgi:hypothetical protein
VIGAHWNPLARSQPPIDNAVLSDQQDQSTHFEYLISRALNLQVKHFGLVFSQGFFDERRKNVSETTFA